MIYLQKKGENIQDKMFRYLKDNLVLENEDGNVLPFEKVEIIKNKREGGHHSTINYKIYFKGDDFFKDQLNYHSLSPDENDKITSSKNPGFVLNSFNYTKY